MCLLLILDAVLGQLIGFLFLVHIKRHQKIVKTPGVAQANSFVGRRKKKFDLNCQAVYYDGWGRILDMSILYPGLKSDWCLMFEGTMYLFQKLEQGILAPGLCLFGDIAYMVISYAAVPVRQKMLTTFIIPSCKYEWSV